MEAVRAVPLRHHVIHLYGPGGIGKSMLLQRFESLCIEEGVPVYLIDLRYFEPTPDRFLQRLGRLVGQVAENSLPLAGVAGRTVLLIDTYEDGMRLDRWLRERFFPHISQEVLVVLAGRFKPSAEWLSDPGWQRIMRTISLRNFSRPESVAYLEKRHIEPLLHPSILTLCHGHPLALSLFADLYNQRGPTELGIEPSADLFKILLDRFLDEVPSPDHKAAVESTALVRNMTESLLAAMLDRAEVGEIFDWLCRLSLMQTGPQGIYPHDVARSILVADLSWRNNEWRKQLINRARGYYAARLEPERDWEEPQLLIDYIFLHKDNPIMKPFYDQLRAQGKGNINDLPHVAKPADIPQLRALVAQYEGEDSADLAQFWFERQPENIQVFHDDKGQIAGFIFSLSLERCTQAELARDPIVSQAGRYLAENGPLRPGERATFFRFWMGSETYQQISPMQSRIGVFTIRHYLQTKGLAFTFFPTEKPDFWRPVFAYGNLDYVPELDYEVSGARVGVFVHDWRVVPPTHWLTLLAKRGASATPYAISPQKSVPQLIVLSRSDFEAAVQAALRNFARTDLLVKNPLLHSRLNIALFKSDHVELEETMLVNNLQKLLREKAEEIFDSSREVKFYRALYHAYFQPAPTHEIASEIIDVPYSTFRRHLKRGVEALTTALWQAELER